MFLGTTTLHGLHPPKKHVTKNWINACRPGGFCFILSTVLLIILSFGVPSANADNRIVKIGVYENKPKIFTSDSGKSAGIFIDIIEYIAEKEGVAFTVCARHMERGIGPAGKR